MLIYKYAIMLCAIRPFVFYQTTPRGFAHGKPLITHENRLSSNCCVDDPNLKCICHFVSPLVHMYLPTFYTTGLMERHLFTAHRAPQHGLTDYTRTLASTFSPKRLSLISKASFVSIPNSHSAGGACGFQFSFVLGSRSRSWPKKCLRSMGGGVSLILR